MLTQNDPLTQQVIGCAMTVHRSLGPGFLESVYRNALLIELREANLITEPEKRLKVRYKTYIIGDFIADLIVNDTLIIELKAASALSKADEQQLVNYLKAHPPRDRSPLKLRHPESRIPPKNPNPSRSMRN